jgi:hypothetical protein
MRTLRIALQITLAVGSAVPVAAQSPLASKPVPAPHTYGTVGPTYVTVAGLEFYPLTSDCHYDFDGQSRWITDCGGLFFAAPLHLPAGAKILTVELDVTDSDPAQYVEGDLQICSSAACNDIVAEKIGTVGPADCPFLSGLCSGPSFAGGSGFVEADLSPYDITVDNFFNTYTLLAGVSNPGVTPHNLRIERMQVTYLLQVSPPPATATFTDVPTTHQFFQFIEALHAAGITGGCKVSPPKYCPDDPVTRGQMAVFLSVALGLEWAH